MSTLRTPCRRCDSVPNRVSHRTPSDAHDVLSVPTDRLILLLVGQRSRWLSTVAGDAAFPPRRPSLFGCPFVRRALLMGSLPSFAGDAPLLDTREQASDGVKRRPAPEQARRIERPHVEPRL